MASGRRVRDLPDLARAVPGGRRTCRHCGAEHPPTPTLADVQAVIDRRGPGGLTASDPIWLAGFRINERKVADYRHRAACSWPATRRTSTAPPAGRG